jgi:hypothetical protein
MSGREDASRLTSPLAEEVDLKLLNNEGSGERSSISVIADSPLATTVGEHGIFAVVTHNRTVGGLRSYAQGRFSQRTRVSLMPAFNAMTMRNGS